MNSSNRVKSGALPNAPDQVLSTSMNRRYLYLLLIIISGLILRLAFLGAKSVWLDEAWRREHLPKVEALTSAVLARPALAAVWARHVR
jgi:hypothetical protein